MTDNHNIIHTGKERAVSAEVHDTGAWPTIVIVRRTFDEDDPEQTGHTCRCGDVHEQVFGVDDTTVIGLAPHDAVELAREILRLAEPLLDADSE
jgi:hypothetical protein